MGRKEWNDFYSPMQPYAIGANNKFDSNGEFEFQLQLGSTLYPEHPIRSHAESYYQLRKTLGVLNLQLYTSLTLLLTNTATGSLFLELIWNASLKLDSRALTLEAGIS